MTEHCFIVPICRETSSMPLSQSKNHGNTFIANVSSFWAFDQINDSNYIRFLYACLKFNILILLLEWLCQTYPYVSVALCGGKVKIQLILSKLYCKFQSLSHTQSILPNDNAAQGFETRCKFIFLRMCHLSKSYIPTSFKSNSRTWLLIYLVHFKSIT